jgi:hypothetical protein
MLGTSPVQICSRKFLVSSSPCPEGFYGVRQNTISSSKWLGLLACVAPEGVKLFKVEELRKLFLSDEHVGIIGETILLDETELSTNVEFSKNDRYLAITHRNIVRIYTMAELGDNEILKYNDQKEPICSHYSVNNEIVQLSWGNDNELLALLTSTGQVNILEFRDDAIQVKAKLSLDARCSKYNRNNIDSPSKLESRW